MPTYGYSMSRQEMAAYLKARKVAVIEITKRLIAKGLSEGCGKWGEVFSRHMRKAGFKTSGWT